MTITIHPSAKHVDAAALLHQLLEVADEITDMVVVYERDEKAITHSTGMSQSALCFYALKIVGFALVECGFLHDEVTP